MERRMDAFNTFDCSVCLERVSWIDGIKLESCHHLFCSECLKGFVSSKISHKAVVDLKCPNVSCRMPLQTNDIRACTFQLRDIRLWQEYEELATQAFLDKAADALSATQWSSESIRRCPAERCNFIFQFEPDPHTGKLFICPECDNSFCLNCPVADHKVGPAHDGGCRSVLRAVQQSAEKKRKLEAWKQLNQQADARFNELLARERARGITKPCPSCNAPITKNRGCDHMRCTRCQATFNWSRA